LFFVLNYVYATLLFFEDGSLEFWIASSSSFIISILFLISSSISCNCLSSILIFCDSTDIPGTNGLTNFIDNFDDIPATPASSIDICTVTLSNIFKVAYSETNLFSFASYVKICLAVPDLLFDSEYIILSMPYLINFYYYFFKFKIL